MMTAALSVNVRTALMCMVFSKYSRRETQTSYFEKKYSFIGWVCVCGISHACMMTMMLDAYL